MILKNIGKTYISKSENKKVLENVNYNFSKTGLYVLFGPSGCGKSTLLNLIAGFDTPTEGIISFGQNSIGNLSKKDLSAYQKNNIGFVFQDYHLIDYLSVEENVNLSLEVQDKSNLARVNDVLASLQIDHLSKRKSKEISGGEKARVAIARALVKNPTIILADEPTGNLDSNTSREVWSILKEVSKEKLVIVASHDESAKALADRVIFLEDGTISNIDAVSNIDETNYTIEKVKTPFKIIKKNSRIMYKKSRIRNYILSIIFLSLFAFLGLGTSALLIDLIKTETKAVVDNYEFDYHFRVGKENASNIAGAEMRKEDIENVEDYLKSKAYYYEIPYSPETFPYGTLYYDTNKEEISKSYSLISGIGTFANINEIIELKENDFNMKYIGSYPDEPNEIMISNIWAELIMHFGFTDAEGNAYFPKSYEQIASDGKLLPFGDSRSQAYFKITGVYELHVSPEEYKEKELVYVEEEFGDTGMFAPVLKYDEELAYVHNKAFDVYSYPGFLESLEYTSEQNLDQHRYEVYADINGEEIYLNFKNFAHSLEEYNGKVLNNNEIVMSNHILNLLTDDDFDKAFKAQSELSEYDFAMKYMEDNNILGSYINLTIKDPYDYSIQEEFVQYELKVIDYIPLDAKLFTTINEVFIVSPNVIEHYTHPLVYAMRFAVYESDENRIEELFRYYDKDENYEVQSYYYDDFLELHTTYDKALPIAFYITGGLVLLIILYLSISGIFVLHTNTKNIAILKSLGLTDKEIRNTFLLLMLKITLVPVVITLLAVIPAYMVINSLVSDYYGYKLTLLIPNVWLFVFLIIIYFVILFISIVLPSKKIAKMKVADILSKRKD